MTVRYKLLWLQFIFLLGASTGCDSGFGSGASSHNEKETGMMATSLATDLATIRRGRILFSHHSVGANILAGIKRLDAENGTSGRLRFASLRDAAASRGAVLFDVSGGRNGAPKTKIDFFAATLRGEKNLKPDLAFMKLCYVDFNPQTDVGELFDYYRNTLNALKREHPEIRFGHVTAPLKAWPTEPKWKMYRLMGREVWEDAANVKRAEFNRLLRQSFGTDPVFDLAQVEATAPDGSLTTFDQGGQQYLSLYPGYTEDGGHLNETGQHAAGMAAIRFMAEGLKQRDPAN